MKNKKINNIKLSLILLILSLSISCSLDDNDEKFENLSLAREKWSSKAIKDYSINEHLGCFCGGFLEWEVIVEDNIKKEVIFDETKLSGGQTYASILERAKTVEDLFSFIENFDVNDIAIFDVEYDQTYGYPKSIYIDYDSATIDDEIGYTYNNFTPLN